MKKKTTKEGGVKTLRYPKAKLVNRESLSEQCFLTSGFKSFEDYIFYRLSGIDKRPAFIKKKKV